MVPALVYGPGVGNHSGATSSRFQASSYFTNARALLLGIYWNQVLIKIVLAHPAHKQLGVIEQQ